MVDNGTSHTQPSDNQQVLIVASDLCILYYRNFDQGTGQKSCDCLGYENTSCENDEVRTVG